MTQATTRRALLVRAESMALKAALVMGGSLLLWLSAKVQVPFWPVPMTLQTLAILGLAAVLGSRLGTAAVLAYIAQGAAGLPVFAGTPEKGIGLAYMMGPTGGYILGFVLAAFAVGWLAERGWARHPLTLFIAALLGVALIHAPGLLWLAQFTGWSKVLALGFWPFIGGDVLKAAIVALAIPATWKLCNGRQRA